MRFYSQSAVLIHSSHDFLHTVWRRMSQRKRIPAKKLKFLLRSDKEKLNVSNQSYHIEDVEEQQGAESLNLNTNAIAQVYVMIHTENAVHLTGRN